MATVLAGTAHSTWLSGWAPEWKGLARPALALIGPLLVLLAWYVASGRGWLPDVILPAPGAVWATFRDLFSTGELVNNLSVSLFRLVKGYLIGAAIGLALGAAMGVSRTAEELFYPSLRAIAQVPFMAWLPLLVLLVGIGEPLKLIAIGKGAGVPIALSTFGAVRSVPLAWREVAQTLCLGRAARWRHVIVPAIAVPLVTGLRQGLGNAWVALVGAELLASTEGLGYMMNWGRVVFQLDIVIVGIVVVGLTGLLLDRGLRALEARVGRQTRAAR